MPKKEYLYQVSIDRLEITYTTTDEMKRFLSSDRTTYRFGENGEIVLTRMNSRFYENEFTLRCDDRDDNNGNYNRLVGYLRFGSYNKNRQNVYLTFDNEALYSWLVSARYYIEGALQLQFLQISKLDIAVDFNFNVEKYLIRQYKDETYDLIVNGRRVDNMEVDDIGVQAWSNPRRRLFANPQLLSKDEKRTLTLKTYNKRKEIKKHGKYYIQNKTGFYSTMYRIEVTCKNHKSLKKTLDKFGLTDEDLYIHLDNETTLLKVFSHLLYRIIHLRKKRKPINILTEALKDLES